jgi:MoxR-like ATPase
MSTPLQQLDRVLQDSIGAQVLGMHDTVRALGVAVAARGHVLVQGVPGLGKTLLAKTLAAALGGTFKRIQGTSDLMPSDIIGVHVFDARGGAFSFRPGPLFADVVLFDEVNRAGPKTQSALLEAMEERQVSVEREQFVLPQNFLVIATQNPREFEGTYPLPESQLDRFMLRIDLTYPAPDDEQAVLLRYGTVMPPPPAAAVAGSVDAALLTAARAQADALHVAPEVLGYVLALARASREHAQLTLGLSSRGALALLRAARCWAGFEGADYVAPDDVKAVAPWVLPHRLALAGDALLDGVSERNIVQRLLEQVPVPR